MNRVVLIGNGFDLAHGLKSSYTDFIRWYWDNLYTKLRISGRCVENDGLCEVNTNSRFYGISDVLKGCQYYDGRQSFASWVKEYTGLSLSFSNLLGRIERAIYIKNWVDIEHEYYELLKKSITDGYPKPKEINDQLYALQLLLSDFLKSLDTCKTSRIEDVVTYIYEPIQKEDIAVSRENEYSHYIADLKELDSRWMALQKRYGLTYSNGSAPITFPNNVLILNFNYTPVSDLYEKNDVSKSIHIHGTLDKSEQMIFGYGDDLDEDHKLLVKPQDNELLRNDKSVRYLETDNYRKMLQFIDSDTYQVYVMGHSCGNSDRTLLNTLFEHKNCVSIKPFYYEHNGKDNYLDIVQNISRNFTNAQLMRDRVVNKTQCHPLPQAK